MAPGFYVIVGKAFPTLKFCRNSLMAFSRKCVVLFLHLNPWQQFGSYPFVILMDPSLFSVGYSVDPTSFTLTFSFLHWFESGGSCGRQVGRSGLPLPAPQLFPSLLPFPTGKWFHSFSPGRSSAVQLRRLNLANPLKVQMVLSVDILMGVCVLK